VTVLPVIDVVFVSSTSKVTKLQFPRLPSSPRTKPTFFILKSPVGFSMNEKPTLGSGVSVIVQLTLKVLSEER
jgi:hypothetical protein